MGFSSYECNYCSKSILSTHTLERFREIPERYSRSVWFPRPGDEPIIGMFDGYGRVFPGDGRDINVYELLEQEDGDWKDPMVFHKDCWEISGKPTSEFVPSERSDDQGYFIDPERYP